MQYKLKQVSGEWQVVVHETLENHQFGSLAEALSFINKSESDS